MVDSAPRYERSASKRTTPATIVIGRQSGRQGRQGALMVDGAPRRERSLSTMPAFRRKVRSAELAGSRPKVLSAFPRLCKLILV